MKTMTIRHPYLMQPGQPIKDQFGKEGVVKSARVKIGAPPVLMDFPSLGRAFLTFEQVIELEPVITG